MVFGLQTQPKIWLTGYTFKVNHYLEMIDTQSGTEYYIFTFNQFLVHNSKYIIQYCYEKKGVGVSRANFEKYHGTFLVIIMLKFVSNIRYTVKKSMKQNKLIVIRFFRDFCMS